MEQAKQLLENGRLSEAIQSLNSSLKTRPTDSRLRVFLFELLCFQGDLDRAEKQLDVLQTQNPDVANELALQVYRNLLESERVRRRVFDGDELPSFVSQPPAHVELYVLLLKKMHGGKEAIGQALSRAEEESPDVAGRADDAPFSSCRDGDDRLAPVLEAVQGSRYLWLPLRQIRTVEISPPSKLRDLAWIHAKIETTESPLGDVFLPALYPDSFRHEDEAVRLGRKTEWSLFQETMVLGAGQRLFLVDERETPLLSLRRLEFQNAEEEA